MVMKAAKKKKKKKSGSDSFLAEKNVTLLLVAQGPVALGDLSSQSRWKNLTV